MNTTGRGNDRRVVVFIDEAAVWDTRADDGNAV
jgi:hypothetical protein